MGPNVVTGPMGPKAVQPEDPKAIHRERPIPIDRNSREEILLARSLLHHRLTKHKMALRPVEAFVLDETHARQWYDVYIAHIAEARARAKPSDAFVKNRFGELVGKFSKRTLSLTIRNKYGKSAVL